MTSLEELAERIARAPFNSWLGLTPVAIDENGVTIEIETRPEMRGNTTTGFIHGGVVSAIIDAVCSYAWLAREGGLVSTIDLRTDFHRPVATGKVLVRADIIRAGKRIVTVDARVTDTAGRLLASGRAVMTPIEAPAQPAGAS